ncbi:unnamed protein product [Arctia plantaginis]|uniref:Uncharacterized protein n=1 Tax=Arctia plantaginis TaxID=874455 RepID=A0A8S1BGL1_ARCPL|nr:unnamed protein product [Arctia plantaginis]
MSRISTSCTSQRGLLQTTFYLRYTITSDEDFLLYKATPLPLKTETTFSIIQLQSQYIAVNFLKNNYISISEDEIKLCTVLKRDRITKTCEYLAYRVKAPCEADTLAKHLVGDLLRNVHFAHRVQNGVKLYAMTTFSIVTLMQGCLLQGNDFTIYSLNEYKTNMKMDYNYNTPLFISTVTTIIDLTHHNVKWEVLQDTIAGETKDIDRQMLSQKEQEVLPVTISSPGTSQPADIKISK